MLRALIVDDEALVRRGIKKSVNWNELGIEMVAEADNGVEALSQVLENVPDVILLDINMPKMDGLEFASIVKKQYPYVKIVIITGYDDFEYARHALRVGVDDYIVKPITKEDVSSIIKTQINKIEKERKDKTFDYSVSAHTIKENMINAFLKQEWKDLSKFCDRQKWVESQNVYFVLMQDYLSDCEIWNDGQADHLAKFAILNIADEMLEEEQRGVAVTTNTGEIALIVSCSKHQIVQILQEIQSNILDFLGIPVDFAVSLDGHLKDLPKLAKQAKYAMDFSFVLADQEIIFYEEVANRKDKVFEYPEQLEVELLEKMFTADLEQNLDLIDRFFDQLSQSEVDVAQCKNMLLRLLFKVSNTIESVVSRTDGSVTEGLPEQFDPLTQMDFFATIEDARLWLKQIYSDTYHYLMSITSRTGQLFLRIKSYVEKNYSDSDLNLKKCSEELFLSPSYISMILKKEAGKTFVDYLNMYRISKATEMLNKPENKIYEVSTGVGFTHPTYFSSVFKKVMGISPKQYKENS